MDIDNLTCLILAFRRPDCLYSTVKFLERQGLKNAIFSIDGPRTKLDVLEIEKCRNIAIEADIKNKLYDFNQHNHGLVGILNVITSAFERTNQLVIIEEDCEPLDGCLEFLSRTLSFFKNNSNIFSIG